MSNLKVNTINDASGGSAAVLYGVASPPNSMGFRNRIINGDMRIDQRNAGASVTANNAVFGVDRFRMQASQTSKGTIQRSTTAPVGFSNSFAFTSSSAYSVLTGDYFTISQFLEGFNTADLNWGTANAQAVTLSFWVRSSLAGTFGVTIQNGGGTRAYPATYTISAANTWEQKTIVIPGDTTGTWPTDNTRSTILNFGLGVGATYSGTAGSWSGSNFLGATGATSVVGTNGATFYITGVQLEAGTVASPFERRDYGRELIMCQRYYERVGNENTGYNQRTIGAVPGDGNGSVSLQYVVTKRATPTITDIDFQYYNGSAWASVSGFDAPGTNSGRAIVSPDASNRLTRGQFAASAEL